LYLQYRFLKGRKLSFVKKDNEEILVGWREWLALPELGIPAIKAKIDTGARTSALHAFELDSFREDGTERVRFGIHPLRKRTDIEIFCVADVIDQRLVTDSGGHREERFVIRTQVQIRGVTWPVEMTLTNRDTMLFRMLLGRTAMRNRILVNPAKSYLTGRNLSSYYNKNK
jgi:hypothetical protein